MEEPKFGFERREEKKKIEDDSTSKVSKIFTALFFSFIAIPVVIWLFIFSIVPIFLYATLADQGDRFIEIKAYRSNECSFISRECMYNYYVDGQEYIHDKNELGFNFKEIVIYYDEYAPYNSVKSKHSIVYYLLSTLPFLVVLSLIFAVYSIAIKRKEDNSKTKDKKGK